MDRVLNNGRIVNRACADPLPDDIDVGLRNATARWHNGARRCRTLEFLYQVARGRIAGVNSLSARLLRTGNTDEVGVTAAGLEIQPGRRIAATVTARSRTGR